MTPLLALFRDWLHARASTANDLAQRAVEYDRHTLWHGSSTRVKKYRFPSTSSGPSRVHTTESPVHIM